MIDDPLTPEEQGIRHQLRAAQPPKLNAAARELIRQQMLDELHAGDVPAPERTIRARALRPIQWIATAAAAAIVVAVALIILQHSSIPSAAPSAMTLTATHLQIAAAPTVTPSQVVPTMLPTHTQPTTPFTITSAATAAQPSTIVSVPTATATLTASVTASPAPADTSVPTATTSAIVILEGPVTNVGDGSLTINGFTVQLDPQNPILPLLDTGDTIRVEGTFNADGVVAAQTLSNNVDISVVNSSPATVSLDGPVQSINGSQLVVNSVPVQLAPDDPLRAQVHPGDFVHVQGNFQGTGAATVLIVVNITIINNVTVNGVPTCRYDVDAMGMGHWHCDTAMGMGDDGMGNPLPPGMGDDGMGNPPPPGMGDDGMGNPPPPPAMGGISTR